MTSVAALAHWPSCSAVPPETPSPPTICPLTRRGTPPSTGIAPRSFVTRMPMPPRSTAETDRTPKKVRRKDYANVDVKEQVTSAVTAPNGTVRSDPYTPIVEVKKGHMYVVRVVDDSRDFYVIVRVDDLERGERVILSYFKLELIIP